MTCIKKILPCLFFLFSGASTSIYKKDCRICSSKGCPFFITKIYLPFSPHYSYHPFTKPSLNPSLTLYLHTVHLNSFLDPRSIVPIPHGNQEISRWPGHWMLLPLPPPSTWSLPRTSLGTAPPARRPPIFSKRYR